MIIYCYLQCCDSSLRSGKGTEDYGRFGEDGVSTTKEDDDDDDSDSDSDGASAPRVATPAADTIAARPSESAKASGSASIPRQRPRLDLARGRLFAPLIAPTSVSRRDVQSTAAVATSTAAADEPHSQLVESQSADPRSESTAMQADSSQASADPSEKHGCDNDDPSPGSQATTSGSRIPLAERIEDAVDENGDDTEPSECEGMKKKKTRRGARGGRRSRKKKGDNTDRQAAAAADAAGTAPPTMGNATGGVTYDAQRGVNEGGDSRRAPQARRPKTAAGAFAERRDKRRLRDAQKKSRSSSRTPSDSSTDEDD